MIESDERVRRLLDRLEPRRVESDEWDDVLQRLGDPGLRATSKPTPQLRSTASRQWGQQRHERWRLATPVALIGLAAAVTLTVTTPWRSGPTILEQASAAINPSAPQVIYQRFTFDVLNPPAPPLHATVQLWMETAAPHQLRLLFSDPGSPDRAFRRLEFTAAFNAPWALLYDQATNTISGSSTFQPVHQGNYDPVALIRKALADGKARVVGKTRIGGKQVYRITLNAGHVTYYVDAKTYDPVRIDYERVSEWGVPSLRILTSNKGRGEVIERFLAYRQLGDTPQDEQLTNIEAQHPSAKVLKD